MKTTALPRTKLHNDFVQHLMPCLPQILVIESDTKITQLLELELSFEGYQVQIIHDGTEGLIAARSTQVDLIILGWKLPGISSLEICQRLRTTGDAVPIIVLTSGEEASDRITSLNAGANDCISKPFDLNELIARVQVHLRHLQQRTDLLQFGDIVLNSKAHQVYRGGEFIDLTAKEFAILEYLMIHPNQVVSRELLLERVWGYDFVGTSNIIEVYIGYLRRKLEVHNKKRLIHTIRGVGYVLRLH